MGTSVAAQSKYAAMAAFSDASVDASTSVAASDDSSAAQVSSEAEATADVRPGAKRPAPFSVLSGRREAAAQPTATAASWCSTRSTDSTCWITIVAAPITPACPPVRDATIWSSPVASGSERP